MPESSRSSEHSMPAIVHNRRSTLRLIAFSAAASISTAPDLISGVASCSSASSPVLVVCGRLVAASILDVGADMFDRFMILSTF